MMRRRLLPVFLSMSLLCPVLAAAAAGAEEPGQGGGQSQVQAPQVQAPPVQAAPSAKNSDGRIPVTRSDGSTGLTRPPTSKEIRKLVGYMRDGMHRADQAEGQRTTRRVNQNKRIYIKK
jgi:hypothetical protein